jgi:hypothetical protein
MSGEHIAASSLLHVDAWSCKVGVVADRLYPIASWTVGSFSRAKRLDAMFSNDRSNGWYVQTMGHHLLN